MNKIKWLILFIFYIAQSNGQNPNLYKVEEVVDSTSLKLFGTLLIASSKKSPVILFVAGSGPTDRNGNNSMLTNNCTKKLAEELALKGISSLRFDKRGIGQSKQSGLKEEDIVFETMIEDAQRWVRWLKKDKRFKRIILVGHSEGSLVGMVAANREHSEGFISLAGAGRPIDAIIQEQVLKNPYNPPAVIQKIDSVLLQLRAGNKVENIPPYLTSLFRSSVQPFMISWLKYDPAVEISKLKMPVLIVQGTSDIQVTEVDSELLSKAQPGASYVLIKEMNHIFRNASLNREENISTYNKPELPLSETLVPTIFNFITKIK